MTPQETDYLEKRLDQVPSQPGVYLMKNAKGRIIYVGKAKRLNRRVRSYFDGRYKEGHRAANLMLSHIRDIEWVITQSEAEALVLEANLIRKHWPRYNVRQKDDKHFPYLMLTMREPFPRLRVVRQLRDDGNLYFGPYLNVRAMRTLLDLIPRLFQLRECDLKLPLKKTIRPCLAWHIGRCDAPCDNRCTQEDYAQQVKQAIRLLEGRREDLIQEWQEKMQAASAALRFEEAAKLRDHLQALQITSTRQGADSGKLGLELDALAVCRSGTLACIVLLEYRQGVLQERRHFSLECNLEQDESEILLEFLPTWYLQNSENNRQRIPPEILLEQELPPQEQNLFEQALSDEAKRKIHIAVPQRGEKPGFLRIARANAEMLLVELKARQIKYDEIDRSVFDLQKVLGLSHTPFHLECFDISHLGGTGTVASMVCFKNGRPSRKDYRIFKIKTVQGIDDFASMREVVGRRLQRLLNENQKMPDLIVIDGGKGQVEAAWAVVNSMGLHGLPMIGLAKRLEEIVFPGQQNTLILKRTDPALKLLQRARDEAHRFAITHQRKSRKASLRITWLADVEGVGTILQKKILTHWKTPQAFLEADESERVAVLGVKRAQKITEVIQQQFSNSKNS